MSQIQLAERSFLEKILGSRELLDPDLRSRLVGLDSVLREDDFTALEEQCGFTDKGFLGLSTLERTRLERVFNQLKVARLLDINYRNVNIVLEGKDNIPNGPFIVAMNHSDAFSYWPLQYKLLSEEGRMSSVWVKGSNRPSAVNWFFNKMGLIQVQSEGYMQRHAFRHEQGRKPTRAEGNTLKIKRPEITEYHRAYMGLVGNLTEQALDNGLYVIIFPEGTRSVRIDRGRFGVTQLAASLGVPILPIACNGGDLIYPGWNPWARAGDITYRIGEAIDFERDNSLRLGNKLNLAQKNYLEKRIKGVMGRIHSMLDERHQNPEIYSV